MKFAIEDLNGRVPLAEYPWQNEVDKALNWLKNKDRFTRSFCFDVIMSCAYIDATSGIEKNLESCSSIANNYNAHLGFINLCSPCYEIAQTWQYQKAVKPQSGALGKLSSEIILKFIAELAPDLEKVQAIGGTECADAILWHKNGSVILAEVKSAPLLTYPFLFKIPTHVIKNQHQKIVLTSSQLKTCQSALYLHNQQMIPLGEMGVELWPFKPVIDFIVNPGNETLILQAIETWKVAKQAYTNKDKSNTLYYLANASGNPPLIAKTRDLWPQNQTISDSKTSAGMDRTDDIKKAIYQALKIGTQAADYQHIKTAIISNLPALRHGDDYVSPFIEMLWGLKKDLIQEHDFQGIRREKLRYLFDYIITLEDLNLKGIEK